MTQIDFPLTPTTTEDELLELYATLRTVLDNHTYSTETVLALIKVLNTQYAKIHVDRLAASFWASDQYTTSRQITAYAEGLGR